jgi:hypothetical protein
MDSRANPLYWAVDACNFNVVYCLLHHPKVKRGAKDNLSLRDYQVVSEDRRGRTVLHNLINSLITFSYNDSLSKGLLGDVKRCLYAILLSGVDVREKISTLITDLDLETDECMRLNTLITEVEAFIAGAKKDFGRFGQDIVHRYIFSSEQEQKDFEDNSFLFKKKIYRYNNAAIPGKEWPVELSTLVFENMLNTSSSFFTFKSNKPAHNAFNEMSNINRLTL